LGWLWYAIKVINFIGTEKTWLSSFLRNKNGSGWAKTTQVKNSFVFTLMSGSECSTIKMISKDRYRCPHGVSKEAGR
jgi:hypothetical protein